jgi:NAD(P)-dependent dehydrogenase (short-subunit alcohol dehydrogenase family)
MSNSTPFLTGRTALITGSALRLGDRIAQHLSANGASNYYRSHEAALLLVDRLRCEGRQAIAVQADITKEDPISYMTQEVFAIFGSIDILVHNAGPYTETPLMALPVDVWDTIVDTNLKGAFLTAKAVHVGMRERGWGRIINISAGSAFVRNHTVYGLAKTALNTLTETLALELAPEVTVNAIAPGMIDDPDVDAKAREEARITTPTLRLVTYEEIARMVSLVCSPDFVNITGQVICMDGGKSLPHALRPTSLKSMDGYN